MYVAPKLSATPTIRPPKMEPAKLPSPPITAEMKDFSETCVPSSVEMENSDYYLYAGSHGCVNTPEEAMKTIYDNVTDGIPIISYHHEKPVQETPEETLTLE